MSPVGSVSVVTDVEGERSLSCYERTQHGFRRWVASVYVNSAANDLKHQPCVRAIMRARFSHRPYVTVPQVVPNGSSAWILHKDADEKEVGAACGVHLRCGSDSRSINLRMRTIYAPNEGKECKGRVCEPEEGEFIGVFRRKLEEK